MLPFRVVYVTSESECSPATELELACYARAARGWSSSPDASWPQEIGVEFERGALIDSIGVTAHAFRIPSRVEIWLGRRDGGQRSSLSDGLLSYKRGRFTKLGYLRFGDNSANNFEAQEQRTVRGVDAVAEFIRLVCHRPHKNALNASCQCALMALVVKGRQQLSGMLSDQTLASLGRRSVDSVDDALRDLGLLRPYFNNEIIKDERSATICSTLRDRLASAVKTEDYGRAAELKRAITRVVDIGARSSELRERMRLFAEREDYDTSAKLRDELRQLEALLVGISDRFCASAPRDPVRSVVPGPIPSHPAAPERTPAGPEPAEAVTGNAVSAQRRRYYDSIAVDPLKEAVAKALLLRSDLPRPASLGIAERVEAELFVAAFGGAVIECFHSPHPELRTLSLEIIATALPSLEGTKLTLFKTTAALLLQALEDPHHEVRLRAVRLAAALFDDGGSGGQAWSRVTFDCAALPSRELLCGLRCLLPVLLRAAGDEAEPVRDEAVALVLALRKCTYFGAEEHGVNRQLTLTEQDAGEQNWLQVAGQANAIRALLAAHGFSSESSLQLGEIATFAVVGLHHPHPRTKGASLDLLMEIYRLKGRRVERFLLDLDPELMAMVRAGFIEIDSRLNQ